MSEPTRRAPLVLLCSHTSPEGPEDDVDTWHTAQEIGHALSDRWQVAFLAGDDPSALDALRAHKDAGAVVFNLMERPRDVGWPAALARLGLPYTGCDSRALRLSTHKPRMKRLAAQAGLRVAAGVTVHGALPGSLPFPFPVILKPAAQDASIGIDQQSVCADPEALRLRHEAQRRLLPGAWLIEPYLAGTDLAVSLFAENGEAQVLPLIEIPFTSLDDGALPILCHETKWMHPEATFGSLGERCPALLPQGTVDELVAGIRRLVKRLDLTGHARLDFRLDERRQPWFLELNANPRVAERNCYFVASAAAAGIDFQAVLDRLLEAAQKRRPR